LSGKIIIFCNTLAITARRYVLVGVGERSEAGEYDLSVVAQ